MRQKTKQEKRSGYDKWAELVLGPFRGNGLQVIYKPIKGPYRLASVKGNRDRMPRVVYAGRHVGFAIPCGV